MISRSNLHTHTNYCDGKDSIEAIVKQAIDDNFRSLGFSGHAYAGNKIDDIGMKNSVRNTYYHEIRTMSEKYRDQITLFMGLEVDLINPIRPSFLDYTIGSIHFLPTKQGIIEIDNTPELLQEGIQMLGGDPLTLARAYYEAEVRFSRINKYEILGHFDLLTKFDETSHIFDETDKAYQTLALDAIEEIGKQGKIIELNTGAISRGYKTQPYPALFILKRIHELHLPVIISSDAHAKENLSYHFNEAEELLRSLGFTEVMELTKDHRFVPQLLK